MVEEKVLLIGIGSIRQFNLEKLKSRYLHNSIINQIHTNINSSINTNNLCNIEFYTVMNNLKDLALINFSAILNFKVKRLNISSNLRKWEVS